MLAATPTTAERARETGTRGEGGDQTLEIDAAAEDAVFRGLDALHAEGAPLLRGAARSAGASTSAAAQVRVVIDPIDGSLNAKRGLPHHALSIAVADGPTMADVAFGFVHDFGAARGVGRRGAAAARCSTASRSTRGWASAATRGKLELVGDRVRRPALGARLRRRARATARTALRAIGAIAVTLCQVAAGAARRDGRRCGAAARSTSRRRS